MDISSDWVRRIGEIGFMAAGYGMTPQAEALFQGLDAVRPEAEYGAIGRAFLAMTQNQFDEAARLLRDEALKRNPQSHEAQALLGLALRQAGRNAEAEGLLKTLVEQAPDSDGARLAEALLAHPAR